MLRLPRFVIMSVLIFTLGPAASSLAQPTAAIAPTRTSGVAPLAIFFDATGPYMVGDNVGEEFWKYDFSWDFGDPAAGTWAFSQGEPWKLVPVDIDSIYLAGTVCYPLEVDCHDVSQSALEGYLICVRLGVRWRSQTKQKQRCESCQNRLFHFLNPFLFF